VVETESPADQDFGYAALRMAGAGWIKGTPRIVDGAPVASDLARVRIEFHVGRR
jgi:hypothetical protein